MLAGVVGLANAEISMTQTLNTLGLRASKAANVSCRLHMIANNTGAHTSLKMVNIRALTDEHISALVKAPTTIMPTTSVGCLKCGIFAKSGRRSCCARGGSWYRNCGGFNDPTVDHTWFDGIDACKGKLMAR